MIYGYCRVSTKSQADNNSLALQEERIKTKYNECIIYKDVYSAKTTNRPQFNKLVNILKEGDTLCVCKLDRLLRSLANIDIIDKLLARGVTIDILDLGTLDASVMGRFIAQILTACAEMQRGYILENCKQGKERAKLNPDFREGRPPKFSDTQKDYATKLILDDGMSYKEVEKLLKMSRSTLSKAVNKRRKMQEV